MNLEFRKWLTSHGITKEEYESMTEIQQEEIVKAYNRELGHSAVENLGSCMESVGCLLMIVSGIILAFIWFTL